MKESKKIELKINLPLGVQEDGEVRMVEGFFQHQGDFRGVTGSSCRWCSPEDIEEANGIENLIHNFGYLWEEAVADGNTEDSLETYMRDMLDSYLINGGGLFFCHDYSYLDLLQDDPEFLKFAANKFHSSSEKYDFYDPEIGTFDCTSGGRIFDADDKDLEYINPKRALLHETALLFEAGKIEIEAVERMLTNNKIPYKKIEK